MDHTKEELAKIIDSWRNDEDEYRNKSGRKFLSQSDVGSLLNDPKKFRDRSDVPYLAFLLGSYYHEAILEPHKLENYQVVDASTRSTKLYKEALEASGEDILLLQHEKVKLDGLVAGTLENKVVRSLIRAEGNQYEVPGVVKLYGEHWKGRADILAPNMGERGMIIDLKTTTELEKFKYKAKSFNYDAQAAIYSRMFGLAFVFIACCKNTGNLAIFECSDSFIESGLLKVEKAVDIYRKFYKDKTPEETKSLLANNIKHEQLF